MASKPSAAVPWAVVGFLAGAAVGWFWAGNAKEGIGKSVSTSFDDGEFVVRVDAARAVASGFLGG